MKNPTFSLVVVVETTIVGLVAMGIFALLVDQYDRAQAYVNEQRISGEATEMFIALLTAVPPTRTPTATGTRTRTPTVTSTSTVTFTPANTATPPIAQTLAPVETPRPTRTSRPPSPATVPSTDVDSAVTAPPTAPPTLRPTRTPAAQGWTSVDKCGVIDGPGSYRVGSDLSASGDCLRVRTSYVVLDCGGHSIRGTNFAGSGIAIQKYGLLNSTVPSYIEVRNCRVSNFKYGIFVESGKSLVIHDNNSSNNYDDTDPATRYGIFLGSADGGGIRVNNTTASAITGNTTLHQAIGIDIRNSSGITVRANTASDNSAWGINFIGVQGSEISGNTTADNVRKCVWGAGTVGYGCDAGGIVLQGGSSGNTVSNNTITGRNGNGVFIKAHAQPCGNNNSIVGNTIRSVLYNAVELGFCSGNHVNGNAIQDGLDGIWLGYSHDTEIRNNTISNMLNHGIISSNSHNNTVTGNQIVNSNEGIYFFSESYDSGAFSWLPQGDYRSHDNCLCANVLDSNGTVGIRLQDSTANQVTNNTFRNNGRTVVVQGNGDGNNMQGNVGWIPTFLGTGIARLFQALP